ncbi:oxygen-dependent FAD-linked oxidoreductase family protein [Abortiporus biennis]
MSQRRSPTTTFCLLLAGLLIARYATPLASCAKVTDVPPISLVTKSQWNALNDQVGGRLIQGIPFSKPCFPPISNQTACSEIQQHYVDGTIRYHFPGSLTNTEWETCMTTGDQCLLDATNTTNTAPTQLPCKQGSVSPYYIDILQASDVVAAFKFSKKTKVPIVIHNTGHDHKGRSSAPNSLGLWTHNLNTMEYRKSFRPDGCQGSSSGPAVTLGAGVQWGEVYLFADSNNITLVGGSDKGVGAVGGWLQGGGHSPLSNVFGLGVDRVMEFQDLFFALRGGGGGTFGVVLKATILAAPPVTLQATFIFWEQTTAEITEEFFSLLINNSLKLANSGYGYTAAPILGLFATPTLNASAHAEAMQPFTTFAEKLKANNVTGVSSVTITLPSWLAFFETFLLKLAASNGIPSTIGSRLVPQSLFHTEESKAKLLDALLEGASVNTTDYIVFGTTPFSFKADGQTSVTESWRDSVWHVATEVTWNWDTTLDEKKDAFLKASQSVAKLRTITPDAAYQNEADVYEPNHTVSFWGSHYHQLLKIKQKYDPDHLLDCWHCIGWQPNSSRFKCYIPTSSNN